MKKKYYLPSGGKASPPVTAGVIRLFVKREACRVFSKKKLRKYIFIIDN
jgi:hypothetical protein